MFGPVRPARSKESDMPLRGCKLEKYHIGQNAAAPVGLENISEVVWQRRGRHCSASKVQPTVVVNAFPTMVENSKEASTAFRER